MKLSEKLQNGLLAFSAKIEANKYLGSIKDAFTMYVPCLLYTSGIEFYRNVFLELKKYNIEPLVTISHYEMPYHLAEKYDGWYARETIDFYLKYCQTLFNEYKGCLLYTSFKSLKIKPSICYCYGSFIIVSRF